MIPSVFVRPPMRHGAAIALLTLISGFGPLFAATDLLSQLKAADQSLATGFHATIAAEPDPCAIYTDTAPAIEDGVLTSDGSVSYFRSTSFYASAPQYLKREGTGSATDYDEQGNLVVWRAVSTHRRATEGAATELRLYQATLVTPAGEPIELPGFFTQLRHLPAERGDFNDNDLLLLALGRGFSRVVDQVVDFKPGENGGFQFEARGRLGAGPAGVGSWQIDLDGKGLVRRAVFGGGSDAAMVLIETRGEVKAGSFSLAQEGTITLGRTDDRPLTLRFRVQSLSSGFDAALAREVGEKIEAPLPVGAEITDFRQRPISRDFVGDPLDDLPAKDDCCVCEAVTATVNECGHLQASTTCASDWCISNTFNTATCKNIRPNGDSNCRIVSPNPPQPQAIQVPILLANGGCGTGGQAVVYAVKFTWYDGCSGCQPTAPHRHRFACEVAACPAGGLALNQCASPRGIRRACS